MAKMPSIGASLRTSDFPSEDAKLLNILSGFMGDVSDAIGGGGSTLTHGNLSLTDNILCEVVQCVLTHGVPTIVKLRKLDYAKGIVLLGSSTQVVADITATPGAIGATAVVTAYFHSGSNSSTVAFVLFQEGLTGGGVKTFGAWTAPALTNAWAISGGANLPPAYMKDSQGLVHLRGTISGGTIGLAAFTLPTGFRPIGNCSFACSSNGALGLLSVTSAGAVIPVVGSNVSFAIDTATFDIR